MKLARPRFLIVAVCILLSLVIDRCTLAAPGGQSGIPITVTLSKPGYVTLVIDDAQGNRVRNLISETLLPAGTSTVTWDGYDEGQRATDADGDVWERDLTRHRAAPGTYTVRGLVHDRLILHYQFSVNSPGTPPWKTQDGSGAWLADHSPPGSILYLPQGAPTPNGRGKAKFLVCSTSGESGEEFVWLSASGQRLYGMNTGFWGGTHLTRDLGTHAIPGTAAYTFTSGERDSDNNTIEVRAIQKTGEITSAYRYQFPIAWKKDKLPQFKSLAEAYGADGFAVYNGLVVFSITHMNKLEFGDARTHQPLGEASLPAPRDLIFDRQGRLYAISGHRVLRFDHVQPQFARLGPAKTLIATGLEDPHRLTLDSAGNLYITDWGGSHQVKVFTTDGRLLRVIGKPGGPQLGAYDERRMSHPAGMTVDGAGQLWVAEADVVPKRISVWNTQTGAFERAIYGPSQYGGGGKIDPGDPSRLFMDPDWSAGIVTWSLDWKTGASKPIGVAWRSDNPKVEAMPTTAPETILRRDGFQYLTDSYNDFLRYNQDRGVGLWRLDTQGVARPVAIFGNAADLVNQIWGIPLRHRDEITKLWANLDPSTVFFIWTDKNGDQIAEPDEIQFRQIPSPKDGQPLQDAGLGVQVLPDLSLVTTWGARIAAPKIDAHGIPAYDMSKLDFIGDASQYSERVPGGDDVLYVRVGQQGLTGSRIDGTHFWRYQSAEGGQPVPGLLTQPTRLMGLPVTPRGGEAGPLIAENSDRGGLFLLTMDGLFLQTLGGDMRDTPLWRMPNAQRGMSLDGLSFEDEHFHPTITQTEKDGTVYLVVGKEHSSIARLDGLETVKRLPEQTITVDDAQIAALPETLVEAARKTERGSLTVGLPAQGPKVDGDLSDWPASTQWAPIGARASGAVAVSQNTLYAAWRTGDPNAAAGTDGDARYQFKRGGALDLMIGSGSDGADPRRQAPVVGDQRLLVTQIDGRTRAILYRAVAPSAPTGDGVLFESPIGQVHFDQVTDVSSQVTLASSGKGDYELSVPLAVLGMPVPQAGETILGDIGLLRGNAGQTTERLYWNNKDTGLVSDVPTEARLAPGLWGLWQFSQPK